MSAEAGVASQTMLETRGLTKRFGGIYAVRDVSISFEPGTIVGLVGANGAGKSTLLRMIAGAVRPDVGHVLLDGRPLKPGDPINAADRGISAVYQELSLLPNLSVAENLCLSGYPRHFGVVSWGHMRRDAHELFDSLEIDIPVGCLAGDLTLADMYLLEIAKSVRREPKLLILDEPTAALDAVDVERIFAIVRRLEQRGTTVVFVSHRLDEVAELTQRVVVLRDGRYVGGGNTAELSHDALVTMMAADAAPWVAGEVRLAPRRLVRRSEAPRIALSGVSTKTLRKVDFSAWRSEIVGLTGLRGSGRTELCRVLAGAVTPDAGTVQVDGCVVRLRSPFDAMQRGIGFVPAERKSEGLFLQLSVRENMIVPALARERVRLVKPRWERALAERSVGELNIRLPEGGVDAPVSLLSGGNQQKVVLGKWLAANVDVLVLDEPTRGVDVSTKPQIYILLQELAASGMTVVVSCSELPELYELAERIVVLHRGEVMGEVRRPDFDEQEILHLASGSTANGAHTKGEPARHGE